MNFREWLRTYEEEWGRELVEWQAKYNQKGKIPEGFDKEILQQYIAYKNETQTRRLVWATWALAITTILLTIISLLLKQ